MQSILSALIVLASGVAVAADERDEQTTRVNSDQAIHEFTQRGGWACWVSKEKGHLIIRRRSGEKKDRVSLALLTPLPDVKLLTIHGIWFFDADLEALSAWNDLEGLQLIYNPVSDDGLTHIAGLSKLKRLCLWRTHVTGKGLEHLAGLTQLEDLDFQQNKIEVLKLDGLPRLKKLLVVEPMATTIHLSKMPALRILHASDMKKLTGLSLKDVLGLRELDLLGTNVSADDVKQLKRSLPNCEIDSR